MSDANEVVKHIHLKDIHPFPDHPFEVKDDEYMRETLESVKEYGVLSPVIVRPREEGGYEMISGHRRMRACELAGIDSIPAIVRNVDRDAATIMMVDSNLQRETISPMEKARAYKMKLEAIKRQGARTDLIESSTSVQVGQKLAGANKTSRQLLADESPDSSSQVRRYIRLNELNESLQNMVDEKKMGITPACEISYLKPEEQKLLVETIDSEQAMPSLSQAQRMKKLSQEGKLNEDTMLEIMMEQKKPINRNVVLSEDLLKRYFPRSFTKERIEGIVIKLLDRWLQIQKQKQQNRD
ncbi:MAG: ParB/RepB/Spo0J family partition protein [Clostridia bacterium]|nr:ParB/RepB/Spo0J family partition protein [Clostridia bacterium]